MDVTARAATGDQTGYIELVNDYQGTIYSLTPEEALVLGQQLINVASPLLTN